MNPKIILIAFCFVMLLLSCKEKKEALLIGQWQEVDLYKPSLDEFIRHQQNFVDSFGKNKTPEENLLIYGYQNVDSTRAVLQSHIDSMYFLKNEAVNNTQYHFRPDKIVVVSYAGQPDSANWLIDENNKLIMDDTKLKGGGQKTVMDILLLTHDSLKLRYIEEEDTSIASYIPIRK